MHNSAKNGKTLTSLFMVTEVIKSMDHNLLLVNLPKNADAWFNDGIGSNQIATDSHLGIYPKEEAKYFILPDGRSSNQSKSLQNTFL
jgi:hypothetical protein